MNNNKYFMFSAAQMNERKQIEKKIGRNYTPGTVLVNGVYKPYTEIVDNPKNCRYSDAIIVIAGDINKITYKK